MSLDIKQLHRFVVKPALEHIGLGGLAAERLVIGTALTESGLSKLDQIGRGGEDGWGPALGLWQMEKATFDDHVRWMAVRQARLFERTYHMIGSTDSFLGDPWKELAGNLFFAAAMCRVHYYRVPAKLPPADDLDHMASYWKRYYNSELGAGTVVDFKVKAAAIMTLVV
jgi:hypothetical protein